MDTTEGIYDLVFSLGGSCIAALQLRRRELRSCSLPFDWLFHIDDSLLSALTKSFEEDFVNWLNRDNMQELKGEERGTSPYYQYKDLATGFRFIHDFHRPIDGKRVFDKVHKQYVKRIKRLYERIEKSSRIFILLNSRWRIRRELVEDFHAMLETKWPRKIFTIVVVSFSQTIDEKFVLGDYGMIYNYAREENSYDYFQTNFEWEFLDRIELRQNDVSKKRYIDIKKTRHGLRVYVLSNKRNLFGFRIRIMGLELDISLGNAAS